MNRQIPIFLALVLAAALIAVGCGDEGGRTASSTGAGEPLSKEEFIAQADQICAEGDARIDQAGEAFAGTSGEKVDELASTVVVPGYRDQIEQLRMLTPPKGDEAQIERFLDTLEEGVDGFEQDPRQLAQGPALETFLKARVLAREYGFKSCSRGA